MNNKKSKINNILKLLSDLSLLLGVLMIIPLIVSICYNDGCYRAFLFTLIIGVSIYLISINILNENKYVFKYRDGFLVATLVWIFMILFGTLPYVLSGEIPNFFNALFESASGFTTTGASILTNIESLPKSILFYRSFTNFIGGMGILVLLSSILPSLGINGQIVTFNEQTGPRKGKLSAKFSDTSKTLYILYMIITFVEIVLLLLGGMDLFDSVTTAFSTVSTGGFSSYNDGFAHFTSSYLRIIVIIFMVISSINFNLLLFNKKNSLNKLFYDEETRFFISIIVISVALITSCNYVYFTELGIKKNLLDSLFQVTSIISTTGFTTENYDLWPTISKLLLFALFFIGGCAGSTSGGIKTIRILISAKLVRRSFSIRIHPNRITYVKINKQELPSEVVTKTTTFVFSYIIVFFIGFLLLSIDNIDIFTAFSSAASMIGNIGPAFNMTGPLLNYGGLSIFSKIVSTILMIMGRLEILTVFTLFSKKYWNTNK